MAFDGLVLKATAKELYSCLINGRIQKIHQPSNDEILFSIYNNGVHYGLLINVSSSLYSVYLTTKKRSNPLVAPNFCMLLRKYLMGYRIANIYTNGLERILIFELKGKNEENIIVTRKLIVELMGKYSNIILLNNDGIIIDALKRFYIDNGASRNIYSKCQYIFPVSDKIEIYNYKNIENNLNDSTLSNFFSKNFVGISKSFISSSLNYCASLYNNNMILKDELNKETYNLLAGYIIDLIDNIEKGNISCCLSDDNDYYIKLSSNFEALDINSFLDNYYYEKQQKEYFISYRNNLLGLISNMLKKISKKLNSVDDKLLECSNMDKYQLYGELITSNLYKFSGSKLSHIEVNNYYTNELIDIPLDISISPADNAKKYYKKYTKLKNAFIIVQEQKDMLEKQINYLESIVYSIQIANNIEDLNLIYEEISNSVNVKHNNKQIDKNKKVKKQEITSKPISFIIDGYTILIGKNNVQNDKLTFKIASKDDLWFHVKDIQGSHVILVLNNTTPSQEIINKCASLAAYYSKASSSSNVPVDYTFVKYVKKPNKAKPGMVVYTSQKTVNVNPSSFDN